MSTQASRTINPLHFEDLEPHRFEDLVRQLAYGFREWSRIEATGRLGQDEGIDIRALEVVTARAADPAPEGDGDEEPRRVVLDEREWRIQCKRYRQMGPKFVRGVVAEAVPDPGRAPYGLIVAAACDVSAQAMTAFHEERLNRGVREGHMWTKAHLEDLLFLPENDHLLFAYFGMSLGTRRKSQLQQLQSAVTLKRKLLRAFKKETVSGVDEEDVVIHDIADSTYPQRDSFLEYEGRLNPPWFPCAVMQLDPGAVITYRYVYEGWRKPDGSWDFLPDSAFCRNRMGSDFEHDLRAGEYWEENQERASLISHLCESVPEGERVDVRILRFLPFTSILEVDPLGDILYQGAHLYCRYDGSRGPFPKDGSAFVVRGRRNTYGRWENVDPASHKPLFVSLGKNLAKGKPPGTFVRDLKKWYEAHL